MWAARVLVILLFALCLGAAQATTTYVTYYHEPFPGPQAYRDPHSTTTLYVETDGGGDLWGRKITVDRGSIQGWASTLLPDEEPEDHLHRVSVEIASRRRSLRRRRAGQTRCNYV